MDVPALHPWDMSPREAMRLQQELAWRVVREGDPTERDVRIIAGADVAFDKPNGRAVAAVVALSYPEFEPVEEVTVETPVTFPYVPGLLSFRESPPLLEAFECLQHPPDLLMIDGHGYAHPRRFGFACHIGLILALPTIGVAKSRLTGVAGTVPGPRGSRADITDDGEVIGSMLRTRQGVRSIYVSVGHRIGLGAAERWVLNCATGYRFPEPTRRADRLAGEAKRRMLDATLEIIIEQRAGEPGRWEWMPEREEIVFKHELEPMVTHYGCDAAIMNPADGDLLDVMLMDGADRDRAERLNARVIDVLERSDGDDKLLAYPASGRRPPERLVAETKHRIWDWYVRQEKPVTRWGGEDRALDLIRCCREATP